MLYTSWNAAPLLPSLYLEKSQLLSSHALLEYLIRSVIRAITIFKFETLRIRGHITRIFIRFYVLNKKQCFILHSG